MQDDAKATIAQNTARPPETTIVTKPTPPLASGADLIEMDLKIAKFVGKIGLITPILKLSIAEQSHLVWENTHIITQLQHLQKKLSA